MNNEKNKLIGHGFIAPIITPDQHVFGVQQTPVIVQDNGDWRDCDSLPPFEQQARSFFDTYGCSIYNTLTPIEILERKLFKEQSEYAERAVYIGTNTRPPGNNPHVISEWIRGNGLIPEQMLPFTDSLQGLSDYASPNPLTQDYIDKGKQWLAQKTYAHDWVFSGGDVKDKTIAMKEALRSSPLGVSVVAWQESNGLYYKEEGQQDNHWTCCIAYEGDSPIILDSYPPFIKKLQPNYDFGFAKRYSIEKKLHTIVWSSTVEKESWLSLCMNRWKTCFNTL